MKRILLFVNYNKENILEDRTLYSLKYLRNLYDKIVVISNSELSRADKEKIKKFSDRIICHENKGYDFAAWRDGIKKIGWNELAKYDELTLMNDTCYFPMFPIEKYINQFGDSEVIDFFGSYIHVATPCGMPGTGTMDYPGDAVPEHVQSYFMTFKKTVLVSSVFRDFWNNVKEYSDVNIVIQKYETQLTGRLKDAGFGYDAMHRSHDYLYVHPEILLKKQFPFLKIKAVHYYNIKRLKKIVEKSCSEYPTQFIVPIAEDKHLKLIIKSVLPESILVIIRWFRKNIKYIWVIAITLCIVYLVVRG